MSLWVRNTRLALFWFPCNYGSDGSINRRLWRESVSLVKEQVKKSPLWQQKICSNGHKKPGEIKDSVTYLVEGGGKLQIWKEAKKRRKTERPSWLALKEATPDKYLAQENLRRNPGALAEQTTSWFIITSYRPWLMHSNNQGASTELQCPGVLSASDFKHS